MLSSTIQRKRPRNDRKQTTQLWIRYYAPKCDGGTKTLLQVCNNFFCSVLGVSQKRVQLICKRNFESGQPASENRRGDLKSHFFEAKKKAVKSFIERLVQVEKQ